VPPGWDFWVTRKGGEGKYYGYKTVEMTGAAGPGVVVIYGGDPAAYSTDVYARKALQFVDRSLAAGAPFLLFFAPHAPHAPHTPGLRHANLLPGLAAPKPASFNEADVGDKPAYVRAKPALTPAEVAGTDRHYRDRARSLLAVDEAVRAIFDRVQAAGQLGNT
jgi:hypothetical protein